MLLFVILQILAQSTYGEYHIRSGVIPSYLYSQFTDVTDNVFPGEIKIKATLSEIAGTLLYSIDRRRNQLIVTLRGDPEELIEIEFSKQRHFLSLSQLCGCDRCRYERLQIIIRMGVNMFIQCNNGVYRTIKLIKTTEINVGYPNPYKSEKLEDSSSNEGHLWIANTWQVGDIYPNSNQLAGCIFNVTYNGREIKFKEVTPNIGSKCTKTCTKHICNGGRCCETFELEPICNCTASYMNGPRCNDELKSISARCSFPPSMFEMIKLSWQSSLNDIFILQSENIRLRVYCIDTLLTLEYDGMMGFVTRRILLRHYKPDRKYVLVGQFLETTNYFKLFDNTTWYTVTVPTDKDLRQEIFKTMALRSGNGTIEMAYRTSHHDCSWKMIQILEYLSLPEDHNIAEAYTIQNVLRITQYKVSWQAIIGVLVVLISAVIVVFLVYFKRRTVSGSQENFRDNQRNNDDDFWGASNERLVPTGRESGLRRNGPLTELEKNKVNRILNHYRYFTDADPPKVRWELEQLIDEIPFSEHNQRSLGPERVQQLIRDLQRVADETQENPKKNLKTNLHRSVEIG